MSDSIHPNRYERGPDERSPWERWADEKAKNERLRSALAGLMGVSVAAPGISEAAFERAYVAAENALQQSV